MGIEALLAALEKIDGVSKETIAGIRKSYEAATRESETWQNRATRAEATVTRLNELLGGEGKDAQKALETLQQQIKDLTTDRDKFKGEADTLRESIKKGEKYDQLGAIATKAGIDRDGLIAMLKGGMLPDDKVVIEGEGDKAAIKVDGKDLKEYLKSYPYLERALVVTSTTPQDGQSNQNNQNNQQNNQTPSTPPQTPTGGTNGTNSGKNPVLGAIAELGFAIPGASSGDRGAT